MSHCHVTNSSSIVEHLPMNQTMEIDDCYIRWARYHTYSCTLALASISLFIRINIWIKWFASTITLISIMLVTNLIKCPVVVNVDSGNDINNDTVKTAVHHHHRIAYGGMADLFTPSITHLQYLFIVYLMLYVLDRQIEYISRLDFLWSSKLKMERAEAKLMREVNQLLLKNILPIHVANRFLQDPEQITTLYYETYSSCAVLFAAIPNFFQFYSESSETYDGLQYLSVLDEIICEFDKVNIHVLNTYNELTFFLYLVIIVTTFQAKNRKN